MKASPRGLTLIETLAATVLLALLAAVCMPMLRHITSLASEESASPVDLAAISAVADFVLTNPERFNLSEEVEWSDRVIPWPDALLTSLALPSDCPPVQMRVLRPADPDIERVWLVFTCVGQAVARCRSIPKREHERSSS